MNRTVNVPINKSLDYHVGYNDGHKKGFEDGKRAKWISIKDEFPLNDQWVLCFVKKLNKSAFALTEFVVLKFYDNQWYTDEDLSFNDKCFEVTHFMLLNTPPKEQE